MKGKNPSTWDEMALLTAAIKTKCSQVTVLSSSEGNVRRIRWRHQAAPNYPSSDDMCMCNRVKGHSSMTLPSSRG